MGILRLPEKFSRPLAVVVRSVITLMIMAGVSVYVLKAKDTIFFRHKVMRINVLMPATFRPLIDLAQSRSQDKTADLAPYVNFYAKIVEYFPQQADAWGMLGFCYFHLGQTEQAMTAYRQAEKLAPEIFWFHYNLGVVYFKQQQYAKALDQFNAAVQTRADNTMQFIGNSKVVYQSILREDNTFASQTMLRLAEGYQYAYRLITVSNSYLNDYVSMKASAQKAIELHLGGEDDFYYYMGVASSKAGDLRSAENYFQKALDVNPNFMEASYYLSLTLASSGQGQRSKEILSKYPLLTKNLKGSYVLNGQFAKLKLF